MTQGPTHYTGSSVVSESLPHILPISRRRRLIAVPLGRIDEMLEGGILIEEGVAHLSCGIEIGDNPDMTLTEEACKQIELINQYVPFSIRILSIRKDRVIAFDDFFNFIEQIRVFVKLPKPERD